MLQPSFILALLPHHANAERGIGLSVAVTVRQVDLNAYMMKAGELFNEKKAAAAEKAAAGGLLVLEKAAAEAGAVKTDSGLVFLEAQAGEGASPGPTDKVSPRRIEAMAGGGIDYSFRARPLVQSSPFTCTGTSALRREAD